MASPRKFSEKIALHNQKQAEETAAFEQIMKEVHTTTRGCEHEKQQHLHISQSLGCSYRGGSLPNVNQIDNNSIDLQSALNCLEDIKQGRDSLVDRVYRESRTRHAGPHRRPFEKRVDCSPYGSPYLSPPPDSSWRRTNSDSALHQSATIPSDNYHGSTTPPANRRLIEDGLILNDGISGKNYWDPKKQLLPPQHSRPKSCEVPGINICPTEQDQNIVHYSIANNTGSLPDLTNLQFQSPLAIPLDLEDQTGVSYNANNCLRVPSMYSRFLHTCKGVTSDTGKLPSDSYVTSHSPQPSQYHIYSQQPQSLGVSATTDVNTVSWRTLLETRMSYRSNSPAENSSYSAPQSPVSQTFSPVSSPGLGPPSKDSFSETGGYYLQSTAQTNALQEHFRQFSMIDNPPISNVDNIFLSDVNNLQYSQVPNSSLIDERDMLDGTGYYSSLEQYSRLNQSSGLNSNCGGQNHSPAPQTPQTPNSIPNIILTDFSSGPNSDEQMCRHDFVKDIGSVMGGMPDSFEQDFFAEDLKAGLDPISLDELQMLTDPDIVTDAATEDSFRLESLDRL